MNRFRNAKSIAYMIAARHAVTIILSLLVSLGVLGAEVAGVINVVADAGLGPASDLTPLVSGDPLNTE